MASRGLEPSAASASIVAHVGHSIVVSVGTAALSRHQARGLHRPDGQQDRPGSPLRVFRYLNTRSGEPGRSC